METTGRPVVFSYEWLGCRFRNCLWVSAFVLPAGGFPGGPKGVDKWGIMVKIIE
jgi:hypothetical protein